MVENEGLERVVRIEKKFDALSVSVDERFNNVDKRFDEVRDHFVEQREYIEFAYDRLDRRISEGLARVEQRTADGFATADQRISELKREVTEGLSRVERKLDQFIESQSRSKVTTRRARPSKRRR